MTADINQIKTLCEKHKTEPKILIIPSRRMKTQILKTLTDNGVFPLNLAVKTVKEFSYRLAEKDIEKSKLTFIDLQEITEEMLNILRNLQAKNALLFLAHTEITFGICKAVTKTVLELLDSGYLRGTVGLDKIENSNRRDDLKKIVGEYADWKKQKSRVDYTDVTEMAISFLQNNKPEYVSGYALQSCEFSLLETDLIEKLNLQAEQATERDTDSMEFSLQAQQVKFVEAYGDYNEAKEVLRNIFLEKLPFDSVLLVTPTSEPYSQLFYQLMQQYTYANDEIPPQKEFPVTFGTGLPLLLSSPAKLLMLLLDWVGNGYRSHELINIFSSDTFDLKEDQRDSEGNLPEAPEIFSKLNVINFIKNSGLTWQRRSYVSCFENYLNRERNYDDTKLQKCGAWLIGFVTDVFENVPEETEDGVDVELLLESLKSIVVKYKRVYSAFDSQGLHTTLNNLNTTIKGRHVNLGEAVEIIKDYMRDIRILSESPASGRMHITTYNQAAWIERDNVFLIGMGAENFPGMAMENPLLLDKERVSPPMTTSVERTNKNIEIMHSFLESVDGNLTCSYSNYNTVEIRECYPSTLFNKLKEMCPGAECFDVGFIMDNESCFMDTSDYWLTFKNRIAYEKTPADNTEETPAEEPTFTPIWESAEQARELKLTATSILDYLKCKYRYFLKHVLNLKEIKTTEIDTIGWLSSLETGNIYHKIIENFLTHTIENPALLSSKEASVELIRKIATDEIAIFEKELPTASDFHTDRQRKEILLNVEKFAEKDVGQATKRKALYTEYSFGSDESPVIIDLGEGLNINAVGKIDRIDRLNDDSIEILDYKSGSTYGLEDPCDPSAEITTANAQLALYYLALQEIARNSDDPATKELTNIRNLSNHFITAKGNYDIISIPVCGNAEALYKSAFLHICKEISTSVFPPHKGNSDGLDEEKKHADCRYCGYNQVCTFAKGAR